MIRFCFILMFTLLWTDDLKASETVPEAVKAEQDSDTESSICVGYFQLKIPHDFKVVDQGNMVRGVSVERLGTGDKTLLQSIFFSRIAALKSGTVEDDGIRLIYLENRQVDDILILDWKADLSILGDQSNRMEDAYLISDGVMFKLTGFIGNESVLDDRQRIIDVAHAISPREDGHIPEDVGACLPGAFVRLPPENENFNVAFIHKRQSPLGFTVSFTLRTPGGKPLAIGDRQYTPVEIAGMTGDERQHFGNWIMFFAEAGRRGRVDRQGVHISAEYFDQRDDAGSAPVSAEMAKLIWSRVISSIKLIQESGP